MAEVPKESLLHKWHGALLFMEASLPWLAFARNYFASVVKAAQPNKKSCKIRNRNRSLSLQARFNAMEKKKK